MNTNDHVCDHSEYKTGLIPMLSVLLLGDFFVSHDNASVKDIDTARKQSLLAYLLLHRDAPQSRAHIAYFFWPDTSEAQARTNLRNLLHHLRHDLILVEASPPSARHCVDALPVYGIV